MRQRWLRDQKVRLSDLTPLQQYQHQVSRLLDSANEELSERERLALATYIHMRTTIVLHPSSAVRGSEDG